MSKRLWPVCGGWWRWALGAVLTVLAWSAAEAQPPSPAPAGRAGARPAPPAAVISGPVLDEGGPDGGVVQTGCSTCGGGLVGPPVGLADGTGCCGGECCGGCGARCVPGRENCYCDCCCEPKTCVGRFFLGMYQCICCPDPCYEGRWLAVADTAFFLDAARPVTQMRLRWDSGFDLTKPDRGEYFWARERTTPNQLEPQNPWARHGFGKGPLGIARGVDYQDLSLYTEGATDRFSFFVETPYRHVDPHAADITFDLSGQQIPCRASNFGDINVGTKALLLDCQLLQITFQFKTFIPTGDFTKGLGTNHVSLEPSLLFNVRLSPKDYLQGQLAYWIPIGGDPVYQSDIFHFHLSYNRVLCCPCPGLQLIGTVEVNEWSVADGAYTATDFLGLGGTNGTQLAPVAVSGRTTIASAGPGARLFICDKIDVGVGTAFAFTDDHWARELIRAEFRWRF
jgi:hypothetical protein